MVCQLHVVEQGERLRARVQQRISRGKVDLSLTTSDDSSVSARVEVDRGVAEEYGRAARDLAGIDAVEGSLTVDKLIGLPGVTLTTAACAAAGANAIAESEPAVSAAF